ncbi:sensor histidine kinase [Zunongwangia sp. HGR-M22]|uniref:sensor histidine kinase n=1 Tax=Zunongwangia sp. HGR-M22 TaxID=3015168 RepID=UPI0022DD7250|nr:sensor histidine kinase [Zunongwangia sp. HGR-M22]WBL25735.1 histidine kinase [Zunongwangia sp. HGR-M22]
MELINYLRRFRKHQKYFYLSVLIIIAFFIGSSLITPKITSVASDLMEDVRLADLYSKKNNIASEFLQLNSFLNYSKNIIEDSSDVPLSSLINKLHFVSDLALSNAVNTSSYIYTITPDGIQKTEHLRPDEKLGEESVPYKKILLQAPKGTLDTIINTGDKVLNRKAYVFQRNKDTTIIVGYDVDLKAFWKYYSEKYQGRTSYTSVFNKNGICLLHPEVENIGIKIPSYFDSFAISDIFNQPDSEVLIDNGFSQYLGLDIVRYFDEVIIGDQALIVVANFMYFDLQDTTGEIQQYFSWISFLAFITFILLLLIARFQLKKEYRENLRVLKEKEHLATANENYQRENALLQLSQLKKKINPHFLFNTLNSLHYLIETKPNLSQKFVLQLADVYRYLLENRDDNLTSLKKELAFLKQYIFLHKIRFKNSLNIKISDHSGDDLILYKKIPVLALETLVENAIKHNEITKNKPLDIEVEIHATHVIVANSYTPKKKKNIEGHKIGLTYLKNIYNYYEVDSFKTKIVEDKFICILPLLS